MPDARMSENVGQIATALARAQAKMQPPKKDRTAEIKSQKGTYSYHYSDLASLIDAIRGPLAENEIAFVQPIHQENGHLIIETRLIHSSGEWISSRYPVTSYERPQEQGSAITYGRRYSLGSLVGLAPEDDDGEAAQRAEPAKPKATGLDAGILDAAETIVMMNGGDPKELIARASSFLPGDGPQLSDEERWKTDAPFQEGAKCIRSVRHVKSDKWKARTLAELNRRIEALRAETYDATGASDAEAEVAQAAFTDGDIPF